MRKSLLAPKRIRKFLTAVSLSLGASILVNIAFVPEAYPDAVPAHLAKMAASLYKSTEDDLKLPGKNLKSSKMRQKALKILRSIGINHWARGSVSMDASLKKNGARTAIIKTAEGEVVEFMWSPKTDSFLINIKTKPDAKSSEFDVTTLKGKTQVKKQDGSDEDLVLEVAPEEQPVTTHTSKEIAELRGNILGEWVTEEGHIYTISATDETAGHIKAKKPSQYFDRLIEDINKEIEIIKSDKVFIWKNKNTKKTVRQQKFRKLNAPWSYDGEKLAATNADKEIADKEKQIAELLKEKETSKDLDPTSCKGIETSPGARPVKIKIFKPEMGLNYEYDSATFAGTKLCAEGKLKDPKDLGTDLPLRIRQKLVANWNPPQWMELDVLLDTTTGGLSLQGKRWRLNATWTPNMSGNDGDIKSIHSPYSKPLVLQRAHEKTQVHLRFLDQAGKEIIGELPYDQPVQVEVVFDEPQDMDQRKVRLSWSGDEDHWVQVKAFSSDKKVFRSDFMIFVPPEIDEGEGADDGKLKL